MLPRRLLHPPLTRLAASLPLALLAWSGLSLSTSRVEAESMMVAGTPGAKGAQVYCYMRGAGNSHDVSWQAAYALIKRQSASMFKTSPEHAAVMITEAVVQNPGSYPDCGKYLGSLFEKAAIRDKEAAAAAESREATPPPSRPGNL
ncbi:MAG: hypothetical protein RLZZ516_567 [Cyanobacteriota bacterium]|jgi:hypothetical protein|nr:penicillin amidase [Synechococcaceae bacterium WB4_1_0192]